MNPIIQLGWRGASDQEEAQPILNPFSLPVMDYARSSGLLSRAHKRSHEAIRQWVQRLGPMVDRFSIDRRLVRVIFVDETMVKIGGRQAWVWVAYEPIRKVFLGARALGICFI